MLSTQCKQLCLEEFVFNIIIVYTELWEIQHNYVKTVLEHMYVVGKTKCNICFQLACGFLLCIKQQQRLNKLNTIVMVEAMRY